ncbi:MAG: hypothetical protein SVW77_01460, partial [Candidatus Nanohaloarchaea archaeon]|nr:hypothetical protein [Candidatus Nanohaloarchaea archaeon]
ERIAAVAPAIDVRRAGPAAGFAALTAIAGCAGGGAPEEPDDGNDSVSPTADAPAPGEPTSTVTSTATETATATPSPVEREFRAATGELPEEVGEAVRVYAEEDGEISEEDVALARALGNVSHPAVREARDGLAGDAVYSERDVVFLRTLQDHRYDPDVPYSRVEQVQDSGLLGVVVADDRANASEVEWLSRAGDEDVLVRGVETQVLGTDPTALDTDGDGLNDDVEVYHSIYPNADPTRIDVYVEVDRAEGAEPLDESVERDVHRMLRNGTGEGNGIYVHTWRDGTVEVDEPVHTDDLEELHERTRDRGNLGYHHAIVLAEPVNDDGFMRVGYSNAQNREGGTMAFTTENNLTVDRWAYSHELGHTVGINAEDLQGVDSREVPFSTYPSVLNYNSPWEHHQWAEKDFEHLKKGGLYVPPRDGLEQRDNFRTMKEYLDQSETPDALDSS